MDVKPKYNPLTNPINRYLKSGPEVKDVKVDKDTINKLFTSISDGNITKIKDLIIEYKFPLNIKNEQGNTLINHIMKMENVNEEDKYELIDYLVTNGVSISTDNDGITPLHLAAKYQNINFIKSLLKKKISARTLDNKEMNALHYAVMCKSIQPTEKNITDDDVLTPFDNVLRQLSSVIIDMLNVDFVRNYMKIISLTSRKFTYYMNIETTDFIKTSNKKIIDELDKNKNIPNTTMHDLINTNISDLKNKLLLDWKSLKEVDIGIDKNNIWGPLKDNDYNILKYSKEKLLDDFKNIPNTKNEYENVNKSFVVLETSCNDLESHIYYEMLTNVCDIIGMMYYYGFIPDEFQPQPPPPTPPPDILNLDFFNILNDNPPGVPLPREFQICNVEINRLYSINSEDPSLQILQKHIKLSKIFVATKKEQEDITKKHKKIPDIAFKVVMEPGNHRGLPNINIGENFYNHLFPSHGPPGIHEHDNNVRLFVLVLMQDNTVLHNMFFRKINYYFLNIIQNMTNIKNYVKYINTCIITNSYIYIFSHLVPLINIAIINIFQNMTAIRYYAIIHDNTKNIIYNLNELIDKFSFLDTPARYKFIYEIMKSKIKDIQTSFSDIDSKLNDVYTNSITFINSINKFIEYFFSKIGIELVHSYMTKSPPIKLDNVFTRRLYGIPELPLHFTDYYTLFEYNNDIVKIQKTNKLLYEKYVMSINVNNYTTYYNSNALTAFTQMDFNGMINDIQPPLNYKPQAGILINYNLTAFFNPITGAIATKYFSDKIPSPCIFPNFDNIHKSDIARIDHYNPTTHIGKIGMYDTQFELNSDLTQDGDTLPPHIIGTALDDIYYLFKNLIIKTIICAIAKLKLTKTGPIPSSIPKESDFTKLDEYCLDPINVNYINEITKLSAVTQKLNLEEKIMQIINVLQSIFENIYDVNYKWDQILYIIVGKITDKILINFIKLNIYKSIHSEILSQIYPKARSNDYYDIYTKQLNISNEIPIIEIERELKFNFSELFSDLVKTYLSNDQFDITTKLVPSQLHTRFKPINGVELILYSDDYLNNTQNNKDTAYLFVPNIINELVKAGCDINQQDISGHSPIYYAINMYNIELIKTLCDKENGSFVVSLKNNSGMSPLFYALTMLNKHTRIMTDLYFPQIYAKKILEEISSLKKYNNLIPMHIENIYKYLFVILNFNIYINLSNYTHNWDLECEQKFYDLTNITKNDTDIPFITVTDGTLNTIIRHSSKINILNQHSKTISNKYNKVNIKIANLTNQLKTINQRLININNEPKPLSIAITNEIKRLQTKRDEIQKQLHLIPPGGIGPLQPGLQNDLINMLNINNVNLDKYQQQLFKNLKNKILDIFQNKDLHIILNSNFFDRLLFLIGSQNFNKISKNIDKILQVIQPYDEYMLFSNFINNYINNNNLQNKTMPQMLINILKSKLVNSINKVQYNSQDKIDKQKYIEIVKIFDENLDIIKIISKYYEVLNNNLDDYEALPMIYNRGNKLLDEMIDSIIHVIRSIFCTNIYFTIINLLIKNLEKNNTESLEQIYLILKLDKKYNDKTSKLTATGIIDIEYNENIEYKENIDYDRFVFDPNNSSKVTYYKYINIILLNILNEENYKNKRIDKFIIVEMPRIITKLLLNDYFYDNDFDKGYKSIDNVFDLIKQMLLNNTIYPIAQDSQFIKTYNDYLVPYYKELLTLFVPKMMSFIHNYNRYIRNSSKLINIIKILLENAKNEYENMIQ